MDVRVCGPNLNDQSRGTFHVHEANCRDLLQYGPGKPRGGDQHGVDEMLVKDATVYKVIEASYSDQIDEAVSDEQSREDIAVDYSGDFWLAPCCQDLPGGWPSEAEDHIMSGPTFGAVHIVALPEDPEEIQVRYLGQGAVDVFVNACRFRVGNDPEVKRGSLQLTLLHADVGALTSAISRVIAEESAKREP